MGKRHQRAMTNLQGRRETLKYLSLGLFATAAPNPTSTISKFKNRPEPGDRVASSPYLDIREFGAVSSTEVDQRPAIVAALQALPNRQGTVVIPDGDWLCSTTLWLQSYQTLHLSPGATLWLPKGFTGVAIRLNDGVNENTQRIRITGSGNVKEIGRSGGARVEPGRWTALEFLAVGKGNVNCEVGSVTFWFPGTGVRYRVERTGKGLRGAEKPSGWVNGSKLRNTMFYYPRTVLQTIDNGGQEWIAYNHWEDVKVQCGPSTTVGIEKLIGRSWMFTNVVIWDANETAKLCNISNQAKNTIIVGGAMTQYGFVDQGVDTTVIDQWQPKPWATL